MKWNKQDWYTEELARKANNEEYIIQPYSVLNNILDVAQTTIYAGLKDLFKSTLEQIVKA